MATARARATVAPQPRRARRWLRNVLLGLLALLLVVMLAVAGLVTYFLRNPLPQTSGTITLPGLSAPVTVVRDHSGVPHITAANQADLFRAQGYVVAQDRLWQMDFYRRVSAGRLSELIGDATLDTDRYYRTVGLRRVAAEEYVQLDPAEQAILQQYADGVNAFIDTHLDKLPIEFTILGYTPEHWSPIDTIAFGKLMADDLSVNYDQEVAMADLSAKLGLDRASQLLPAYPNGKATIVGQSALPGNPEGSAKLTRRISIFGDSEVAGLVGSNNWVIDGTRTATGRPLLANDPHLSVQNPSIWYAMQLTAQDGSLNVEGVTFAGVPGIVVGHNQNITWGVTNLGPDTQDLYVERLDNPQNPTQYEYMGQMQPLEVVTETIQVKGAPDVVLPVYYTRHGPLVTDVVAGLTQPAALQWTALQPDRLLTALYKLDTARNWTDFHAALSNWDTPAQNFVYADTQGNIGYQSTGLWPIRKAGTGLVPVAGWTGDNEWTGFVPYEQMPSVENPAQHFIVTANNRVVGPDYAYLVNGYWYPWYRAERITDMIQAKIHLTVDDVKAIQYDTHSLIAARVGQRLAALSGGDDRTRQAIALFKNWDGNLTTDSPAAALFEVTYRDTFTATFADDLGPGLAAEYHARAGEAADTLIDILLDDPTNAWWDDVTTPQKETRDDILQRALKQGIADLTALEGSDMRDWKWGGLHTITFNHPLGAVKPLDRLLNFGPFAMPGDAYTVDAAGYNATFSQRSHPSMRMITDPGDWNATQLIFSPGESGQPAAAHWGDLVQDYLQGRYHVLPWDAAAVQQAAEGTLTLQP